MKRISRFFAISAFALMILGLPAIASAQWGNRDRDDDYGNGRYNRNLRATIQNLKNRARNFENVTNRVEDRRDDRDDRYDNRGPWGNNRNRRGGDVGRLEDLADNFRRATDRLEDAYGNGRNLNGSRDEARRVLDIGGQIENEIRRLRGGRNLDRQWSQIRNDLNVIANVYGGSNGGYNRSGDWRNRMPFPLPF
jgi:hypothetical protein